MKEIKAIIQPYMLESVCDALGQIDGLPGLTVSQVVGFGKSRAVDASEPVVETGRAFAQKTKLEVVVPDGMSAAVVRAIVSAARTGKPGDGKVFVYQVEEVVKIRTGEKGEHAI